MSGEKKPPVEDHKPADPNAPAFPPETEEAIDRATSMWTGEEEDDEPAAPSDTTRK